MKHLFTYSIAILLSTLSYAHDNLWSYKFIENKGQIIDQNNNLNPSVKYLWTGNGMKVQLKANSFSYEVIKVEKFEYRNPKPEVQNPKNTKIQNNDSTVIYSHRIDIALMNANPNPELKAEGRSEDYLNYYTTGTPDAGVTYVHHYNKVTYKDIYPNIDLEFVLDGSNQQPFKYNFIIRPGGNVSNIQLHYQGANNTKLNEKGQIVLSTQNGEIDESIPSSYYLETSKNVEVKYSALSENVYGFKSENYDVNQTLIIDPWGTYIGAYAGGSVSVDKMRNSIVAGGADGTFNITTTGAFQTVYGGGSGDAYIMKFNDGGVAKLWATLYGGNGNDGGGATVTSTNDIYLVAITGSDNLATPGSYQDTLNNGFASLLAKFNANGIRQWATYYPVGVNNFTIDSHDNLYMTGFTSISGLMGFSTPNAHQQNEGGVSDAFLVKFAPNGNRLWCTYYGGSQDEVGYGLATDSNDNVFLSGWTMSTNNIASPSAFQVTYGGISDYFIAKFNSSGVRQWGTYYGGNSDESAYDYLACDKVGNVYFAANGGSINYFPTPGAFQVTPSGLTDDIIAKFSPSGNRLWGTYFGGSDDDFIYGITVNKAQEVIITGTTSSTNNISTPGAYKFAYPTNTTSSTSSEGFIVKFTTNGARIWGTYIGDSVGTIINSVTTDSSSNIYITGISGSPTGITTPNTFQPNIFGSFIGFLACFDSTGHLTSENINDLYPKTSLLHVYPNPAKEQITVSIKDYTNKAATLSIQDVGSKLLQTQAVHSSTNTLHLKDLPAGVYLLQYEEGTNCETVKIVKE